MEIFQEVILNLHEVIRNNKKIHVPLIQFPLLVTFCKDYIIIL